jgi:hypothetical protein
MTPAASALIPLATPPPMDRLLYGVGRSFLVSKCSPLKVSRGHADFMQAFPLASSFYVSCSCLLVPMVDSGGWYCHTRLNCDTQCASYGSFPTPSNQLDIRASKRQFPRPGMGGAVVLNACDPQERRCLFPDLAKKRLTDRDSLPASA